MNIIEKGTKQDGTPVRLIREGKKFSVVDNTTGYTWMYYPGAKKVDEQTARNKFAAATLVL